MASANLDLVRGVFEAWERGDFSSAGWAAADVEFEIVDGPAPGAWTGLDGMQDGFRAFVRTWDDWRVHAEDYREVDDERVLVLVRVEGRGKASGIDLGPIGSRAANVFHLHEGKVIRLAIYFDRERARADAGLSRG